MEYYSLSNRNDAIQKILAQNAQVARTPVRRLGGGLGEQVDVQNWQDMIGSAGLGTSSGISPTYTLSTSAPQAVSYVASSLVK